MVWSSNIYQFFRLWHFNLWLAIEYRNFLKRDLGAKLSLLEILAKSSGDSTPKNVIEWSNLAKKAAVLTPQHCLVEL